MAKSKAKLRYHNATARELFRTDRLARDKPVAEVRALERRLGVKLPASVREWVGYFGDLGFLSGQDHARGLDEWEVRDGHLLMMWENQNCAEWGVRPDGSDDPPVFWALPRGLREGRPNWSPVADRFSTFTWSRAWSQARVFDARYNWLSMSGRFGPREAAYLRARYREGPTVSDWPCGVHHHFTNERAYLWTIGEQWMAGARNNSVLLAFTREVWWLVGGGFESASWEETWPALQEMEKAPPAYPGPGWEAVFGDDLAALRQRLLAGKRLGPGAAASQRG
jgi:hypothetical protein